MNIHAPCRRQRQRPTIIVCLTALMLLLAGCDLPALPQTGAVPTTTPRRQASAPTTTSRPSPTNSLRTPTITPVAQPIDYALDQVAASDQAALAQVRLALRRARLRDDALELTVAFENTGDAPLSVTGFVPAREARLVDAWGEQYAPLPSADSLQTISPDGGFAPGGANVGVLRFGRPLGPPPYQFLMPAYAPIPFGLEQPLATTAAPVVAAGEYSLGTILRSAEQALAPISLEVRSVAVTTTTLRFDVSFVNLQRQAYRVRGVDGTSAWLIDGSGEQSRPITVSASLRSSITPGDAWRPGGENSGTITFARPAALDTTRLVFASYEPLLVTFGDDGTVSATVAPSPNATPVASPTGVIADTTFADLTRLLDVQARAVLADDMNAYLATFVHAAHAEQRALLERRAPMPLASYELSLDPAAALDAPDGEVRSVLVDVRYTLRDVPGDSRFSGSLRYDFAREGTHWKVAAVAPGQTPPFWYGGDVAVVTTAHFLIFARPAVADLAAIEQEAEAAYQKLRERGLPLEERYVAYVAATTEDFQTLTGRSTGVVGVAFWQYEVNGDAFAVFSRAFYINAAAFGRSPDARRVTIAHELVHLALADQTRVFTPAWLKEGMAVYFEDQDVAAIRRQMVDEGMLEQLSLPTLTDTGSLLDHADQTNRVGYAYLYAGAALEYLVQRAGEQTVLDFYRSYTEVPANEVRAMMSATVGGEASTSATVEQFAARRTDETLQRFFGLTTEQLDAEVKAWLREQTNATSATRNTMG